MYSVLVTWDAQSHDDEHIKDTGNEDHTENVTELGIAIAVFL